MALDLTKEEAIEIALNADLEKMTYAEIMALFAIIGTD